MDLLEYKGKRVLARYGVPLFAGSEASTVDDAVAVATAIGFPIVVKAQVKIGGRGKLGGIKIADNAEEAREHASNILGMDIRGHTVHELWLQEATDIASEYYAAVVFDRSAKAPLVMLSTQGGMDIEQVAAEHPQALATLHIDPLVGFHPFHARRSRSRRASSPTSCARSATCSPSSTRSSRRRRRRSSRSTRSS
jgi:succinyl-CoA synthetase beta subunit